MDHNLTSLRLHLRTVGYIPLPAEGKATYVNGWASKTDVSADEIRLWERLYPAALNTGILTRTTPTIDIDIMSEDAAEAVEALARERFEEKGYFLVRIGQAPKRAIPLRTDVPFGKIAGSVVAPDGRTEKIELLANGQQFVAFGIHPGTRRPYSWHGGEPGEIKHEDLPYVSEAEAQQFVDDAVRLLVEEHGYTRPDGAAAEAGTGAPGERAEGADWEELFENIHTGTKVHDSICSLAAKLTIGGLGKDAAINLLRALMDGSAAPRDHRWRTRYRRIPHEVVTAHKKFDQGAEADLKIHWHDDASGAEVGRAWLVDGLLPQTGTGLISGQWGVYKTFTALDLAGAVMCGLAFIDYPVAHRGGILFIAAEGAEEIPNRLAGLLATKYPDVRRAPFAWLADCPRLLDPRSVNALTAVARQVDDRLKAEFGIGLALIIVDTVVDSAGYTRPGDENDAALGQILMRALAALSRATGALVVGIDHFGKAVETGTRGSSAKEGRADVVLAIIGDKSITGEVSNTRLAVRKNRAGAGGREISFTTRVVDAGVDRGGEKATTLVIDWGAPGQGAKEDDWAKSWSKSLKLLRRTMMNVLGGDQASEQCPFPNGPTVRAVDIEIVRAEFYKSYPATGDAKQKQAARRQAFNRAAKMAQEKELIGVRDIGRVTYVWLASGEPAQNA
jgi:hypothetical protein